MPATQTVPAEVLYRTSTLIAGFAEIPPAPSFLKDKLFARTVTVASDLVSVEYYKGNQRLAPYCSRFSKGTSIPREKTQLSLFAPPFIKPVRLLTADELFYRNMAEPAAGAPESRDATLLAQDFNELNSSIGRREEWMASQCLFSGSVICRDGDSQEVIAELSYGTVSKTVPAKLWNDPTGDPLADLRGVFRLVSAACGAFADLVVMGRAAADAFETHTKVADAYNKLRITPGELTPQVLAWGVQSLGTYRGIQLFVDETEFEDVDGSMKLYVPADCVLVAATAQSGTMSYAGIAQVEAQESSMQVYEGTRVPLIYYEAGGDIRKFRLSSRPVPVPHNLASWTVLDVL